MGAYRDSTQLIVDRSLISCGILQAHHIPKNISKAVMTLATTLYHKANPRPAAMFIWSDTVSRGRGEKLADKLKLMAVGNVYHLEQVQNPRTGNFIRLYVFIPDHEKFRKWYEEATLHYIAENEDSDDE